MDWPGLDKKFDNRKAAKKQDRRQGGTDAGEVEKKQLLLLSL